MRGGKFWLLLCVLVAGLCSCGMAEQSSRAATDCLCTPKALQSEGFDTGRTARTEQQVAPPARSDHDLKAQTEASTPTSDPVQRQSQVATSALVQAEAKAANKTQAQATPTPTPPPKNDPVHKHGSKDDKAGDDWLGFLGNVVGGIIGAAVAIWLWYKERNRERQRENAGEKQRWNQSKSWLLISLDEVRAAFASELELVRQHRLSTEAALDNPDIFNASTDESAQEPSLLEYESDVNSFINFATVNRRPLPPLQTEYVLWFGNDWCTKYSRLDVSVINFRHILRSASLPQVKLDAVQQFYGMLNRAANTGSQIDELFESVVADLKDKAYDVSHN